MTATPTRKIRRYQPVQRYLHWMGATGFILLLLTGSVLVWLPHVPIGTCCATRQLHRIGAVLYVLWPILYAILDRAGLREMIKESLTFTRDDIAWFKFAIPYFFGRTRNAPPQGRINAGQKLHHLGVIVLSLGIAASGLVMWVGAGRLGASNLAATATIHDLCMLALTILMVGHVYFTLLYGGLDAMLKGYVSEEYARMEHPKWLATLPESAFLVDKSKAALPDAPEGNRPVAEADIASEPMTEVAQAVDRGLQPAAEVDIAIEPLTEAMQPADPDVPAAAEADSKSDSPIEVDTPADPDAPQRPA